MEEGGEGVVRGVGGEGREAGGVGWGGGLLGYGRDGSKSQKLGGKKIEEGGLGSLFVLYVEPKVKALSLRNGLDVWGQRGQGETGSLRNSTESPAKKSHFPRQKLIADAREGREEWLKTITTHRR